VNYFNKQHKTVHDYVLSKYMNWLWKYVIE
jgi:hypothetical protein